MHTVAIVGVGLIGGSFGLALKRAGFSGEILGVSSSDSVNAAVARGAIDRGMNLEAAVRAADLVYLAQPISRILSTVRQLGPWLKPAALVTDAGSTKQMIVDAASRFLPAGAFLGGHPMAGKESRGVENAEADLFFGRPYCLTPIDPAEAWTVPSVQMFRDWLRRIGAREVILSPMEHDRRAALSSHVPQLASTALASLLCDQPTLAGPGLIGATRLALSAFEIWRDILATNEPAIRIALTDYIQKLEYLRDNLRTREMEAEFQSAARLARALRTEETPEP